MAYDDVTPESLEALGNLATVTVLCSDLMPCRKDGCKCCKRREEAWQRSMEMTDMEFENQIWGAE